MIRRVLIANRGAVARRVVRACASLGIESVAVFSDADSGAPYLREATSALSLPGNRAAETYLNQRALLELLAASGADALHPGYGFLAENAGFAQAVLDAGATFIGPQPRLIEAMGDKVSARRLMQAQGFPVAAGSGLLADLDAAKVEAERLGYPLMLKPAAGGGGIGMRVVRSEAELVRAYPQATQAAEASFGNGVVYLEAWQRAARHIEFQVLCDRAGNAMHAFERDCSVQRRQQKVIEEAPAPGLARAELEVLAAQAASAVAAQGYDSLGTVETLRAADGRFSFLEMNTRLQVEHGVTEAVTGLDLVAAQIRLAAGEALPAPAPLNGFAVEARLYSEHPRTGQPATGRLAVFRPPAMHGVRIDTGYAQGQWITPYYDPLLAKVIGWGTTREQAIGRVLIALKGFDIQGVHTNAPTLEAVLQHGEFLAGGVDTGFLERLMSRAV